MTHVLHGALAGCGKRPSFVKRRSSLVALIRRSSLVSRRSQALIFLLSRYASRFTNDGLLEIRFTVFAPADCFSSQLGTGRRCQAHFDARVVLIDVFVEVGFDDAVVVDAESLTEGILRDLEPAIDVSP